MSEVKSALVLAIESRPRKAYAFDVSGFFGLADRPIYRIAIRVNTKLEQDNAIAAAYQVVNKTAEHAGDQAKSDSDLLLDAKAIHVLFHACRRCEEGDEEQGYKYNAFPGPQWMREHMTTDQLAVLLNLYNEVRRSEGPTRWEVTLEQVDALAILCAETADNDIPEAVLASCSREWMTQAFVLLSLRMKELRDGMDSGLVGSEEDAPSEAGDADERPVDAEGGGAEGGGSGEGGARLPEPDGGS